MLNYAHLCSFLGPHFSGNPSIFCLNQVLLSAKDSTFAERCPFLREACSTAIEG